MEWSARHRVNIVTAEDPSARCATAAVARSVVTDAAADARAALSEAALEATSALSAAAAEARRVLADASNTAIIASNAAILVSTTKDSSAVTQRNLVFLLIAGLALNLLFTFALAVALAVS
jgi:hypothetical protein